MPQQSREQFEHFFLQLSLIASTTTRLRAALETGNSEGVEEVMDSAENVGILQFILKMAVAQAGAEVKAHNQDHEDWLAVTTDRLAPLLQSQANAVISNKALIDAKRELAHNHTEANERSKKMLMGLAGNSSAALMAMSFHEWHEALVERKREDEIRVEYAEEIEAAEKRLNDYVETQTATMRKMINKRHSDAEGGIVMSCFQSLVDEWKAKGDRLAKEEEMKQLEERMAKFSKDQKAKSKGVLGRMNAGSDQGIMAMYLQAWVSFIEDYNKNKEFEEAVKAEEKKIAEFKKKQKDNSASVMNRMSAATDAGLVQTVMTAWVDVYTEQKKAFEMEERLAKAGNFGSFNSRNKSSAKGCMERAAEAEELSVYIVTFWYWKRETRVQRMTRYARDKNVKKKQQLIGVKGLFKNFANELEAGLKEGTPRVSSPANKKISAGPDAA